MNVQIRNLLIGIFIIVSCAFLVFFILWFKPSVGDGKQILYVRFSNINQIGIGTRVTYAGKPIGEAVAINTIPDARKAGKTDTEGEIYTYQLTLRIDSHIKVYSSDEIYLQTSGLLGEKSIAIIPKEALPGQKAELITKQPIYATSEDPLEKALNRFSTLAESANETVKEVNDWIKCYGDDLGHSIKTIGSVLDEVKVTINQINQENIIPETKNAIKAFTATMQEANNALVEMKNAHVFTNMGDVMQNIKGASKSIEEITCNIAHGRGTIGKLYQSEDLYLRINALMSKADTMMNDINHYGILFHLNKAWQRQRTERMNLLNALNTPCSFKNYFSNEVDEINTAMARLSMLLEKAEASPEREKIFDSKAFEKDFADLMRDVKELSDNLTLYNQQLMEAKYKPECD